MAEKVIEGEFEIEDQSWTFSSKISPGQSKHELPRSSGFASSPNLLQSLPPGKSCYSGFGLSFGGSFLVAGGVSRFVSGAGRSAGFLAAGCGAGFVSGFGAGLG